MGGISGSVAFSIIFPTLIILSSFSTSFAILAFSDRLKVSDDVFKIKSYLIEERIRIDGFVTYREALTKRVLRMDIKIANLGMVKYSLTDLKLFDLILGYFLWPDGVEWVTRWIPYNQSCSQGQLCWKVLAVYRLDGGVETIDPVDLVTLTGHWNPGEIMELRVEFSEGTEPYYIRDPQPEGGFSIAFISLRGQRAWVNSKEADQDIEV